MAEKVKEYMRKEIAKRRLARHKKSAQRTIKDNPPKINTNLEKKRETK